MTELEHLDVCQASHCSSCGLCGATHELQLVAADLGRGAFLRVYCDTCWHRAKYRAHLKGQLADLHSRGHVAWQ
jgi:hypothetical protein